MHTGPAPHVHIENSSTVMKSCCRCDLQAVSPCLHAGLLFSSEPLTCVWPVFWVQNRFCQEVFLTKTKCENVCNSVNNYLWIVFYSCWHTKLMDSSCQTCVKNINFVIFKKMPCALQTHVFVVPEESCIGFFLIQSGSLNEGQVLNGCWHTKCV